MGAIPKTRLDPQAAAEYEAAQALSRKLRSERILSSQGVIVSGNLPPLDVGQIAPRHKEEIAYRALCLLITAIKAERMDQAMVLRVVEQYGLAAHFSPSEKEFLRDLEPSAEQRARFSWRYESAWVLLWALGYVKKLGIPCSTCDVSYAVACMRDRNTQSFIAGAKLRLIDDMLDQADLAIRYHQAIIDAALAKRGTPANLNARIVLERHYALNWLIRFHGRDWDEVTAETGICDG